ncbi:guanine nucleotide-binding protein g i /g s /g o gamma-13 subunit [Anaeramoeba flamelloides]|uniref:Guanine nucleotide-binding protein g i /g s /g o gamma-13 subunit n=1 Tax=Anaeramoeba flamelloides TaxID=1746091 RepID=A0AAV7YW29_9EUKA|nr:guanine nucleotide-binding protein g i /g s /g o gamma-13 subunit [Anaeramoeba flamelloides]KAJ6242097.1 guanine nucleotide-binding protein g i /g s /g o gamma-13 subunit [Anaeramoeba flamelloides]
MTEKELKLYNKKIEQTKEQLNKDNENVAEKSAKSIVEYTNSVEDPLSPSFDQDKNPWTKQPKKRNSKCGIL